MWLVKHWKHLLYECCSAVFVKLVCYLLFFDRVYCTQCLKKCYVVQIRCTCNKFVQVIRCSVQALQSQCLFNPIFVQARGSIIRVGDQAN